MNIIIPDKLLHQVQSYFTSTNKTHNIIAALQEWIALKESQAHDERNRAKNLEFLPGFTPKEIDRIKKQN